MKPWLWSRLARSFAGTALAVLAWGLLAPVPVFAGCGDYVSVGNQNGHESSEGMPPSDAVAPNTSEPSTTPCPCRGRQQDPSPEHRGPCRGPECSGTPPATPVSAPTAEPPPRDWAAALAGVIPTNSPLLSLLAEAPSSHLARPGTDIFHPPR
jgi:hypothetical protein